MSSHGHYTTGIEYGISVTRHSPATVLAFNPNTGLYAILNTDHDIIHIDRKLPT